jgi:[acyl-carrier-protein] S-malonyltransferase
MTVHAAWCDDVVALFPGQGSLAGGAGRAWRTSPHWSVVERISEVTGEDVDFLLLHASDEELVRTDRAQLATFALSQVSYRELLDRGVRPRYLLGHSLGEFSALVAAGVISLDDGATLIGARGRAMVNASALTEGAMVALMGGDHDARVRLESLHDVWVANVNGEGQIVASGTRFAVEALVADSRELGFRRATLLAVGGAFHCPLMLPAQPGLDDALARVEFEETEHVVIANVDGLARGGGAQWRALLSAQLTSPVEFLSATRALPDSVRRSFEAAPSGILTGLTKRIRSFDVQWNPVGLDEMNKVAP